LGLKVKEIMDAGGYVPDQVTVAMLSERIMEPDAADGFILDGFPRTRPQVEALDGLLGEQALDAVVLFEVSEDELVARLTSRGRSDDAEDSIRQRFRVYQEQTTPLIELYQDRGVLARIDGLGDLDEVTARILEVIKA
jgi:adenylate kinase